MKKALLLLMAISLLGIHNSEAQSKKELKKQQKQKNYTEIKKLIESGHYVFNADWANTQKGRRINIIGDGNTLNIEGVNATADLPFFGQAYTAPYGGAGGIKFTTTNADYEIDYDDKKLKITIKFEASEASEKFDVYLIVYSNKKRRSPYFKQQ